MKNLVIAGLLLVALGGCASRGVVSAENNELSPTDLAHVNYLYTLNAEDQIAPEQPAEAAYSSGAAQTVVVAGNRQQADSYAVVEVNELY